MANPPVPLEKPSLWNIELNDLKLLLVSIILIPLTWVVALGWRPLQSISSGDAMSLVYPPLRDLMEHGGIWQKNLYRLDLMGGIAIHDAQGGFPVFDWCGYLGLNPATAMNLAIFLLQICTA